MALNEQSAEMSRPDAQSRANRRAIEKLSAQHVVSAQFIYLAVKMKPGVISSALVTEESE
ncbi:hypothetical protein TN98_10815 [Pantoea anthophila]|nr:hypothetical protein TN98_10815 [Pantoea anthophila]